MPAQRHKPRAVLTPLRSVMDALVSEYNRHTGHSNTLTGSTAAAFNYFLRTCHSEDNQDKSSDTRTDIGADVKAAGRTEPTERREPTEHTGSTGRTDSAAIYIRSYGEPTPKNSTDKIATVHIDAVIYGEAAKIIAAHKPYVNMTKRYVGSLVIEFFTEHLRGLKQDTHHNKHNTPQEQPNALPNETSAVNALDVSIPTLNTSAHATHTQHPSEQDSEQDTEQHLTERDTEQDTHHNKHTTPQEQSDTQSSETSLVNAAERSGHDRYDHDRYTHIAEIYHNRILDALDAADRGVRVVDNLSYVIRNATDWIIAIHDEANNSR